MRDYEAVLILKPNLTEEERAKVFEKLTSIIKERGEIQEVDEWGLRKLAYEINYIKEGYYYIVSFKSEADVVSELERRARISDGVVRYMVIRKED